MLFILELFIVAIVIWSQLRSYWKTRAVIDEFTSIFIQEQKSGTSLDPLDTDVEFKVKEYYIRTILLQTYTPEELVRRIDEVYVPEELAKGNKDFDSYTLIEGQAHYSDDLKSIILSLNAYLIKNKGAAVDFSLIRDVVERHVDAKENGINLSLSTPLYIGLVGTLSGMIVGLAAFLLSKEGEIDKSIQHLLGTVALGMIGSVSGLLLTLACSGIYKTAKKNMESGKNRFYNFIQAALLPVLSQNLYTGFQSMQLNLKEFNHFFSKNVKSLEAVLNRNFQVVREQTELLEFLKKVDISVVAKSNVKVLAGLNEALSKIALLGEHLDGINSFIHESKALSGHLKDILGRTNDVTTIAGAVKNGLDQNERLSRFLESHFSQLAERSDLIKHAVATTEVAMSDALTEIINKVKHNNEAFVKFSHEESERLRGVIETNRNSFKHLDKLEPINQAIRDLRQDNSKLEKAIVAQSRMTESMLQKLIELQRAQLNQSNHTAREATGGSWFSRLMGRLMPSKSAQSDKFNNE